MDVDDPQAGQSSQHAAAASPRLDAPPSRVNHEAASAVNSIATRIQPASSAGSASKTTLNASQGSSGCRLLWRGRLIDHKLKRPLHGEQAVACITLCPGGQADSNSILDAGIAIIAHLFSVPMLSPHQISAQPSPFDDPFSATLTSGADMCLGLEMLRGGDVHIRGEVDVRCEGLDLGKGKGKAKVTSGKKLEVEVPTDVRLYVDPRCPDTVSWFEDMFCRDGRQGIGLRLDVGGGLFGHMSRAGLTRFFCSR